MAVNLRIRLWRVLNIFLAVGAIATTQASATQVITEPFLGVRLIHQTETSPRPLNINVVEIDLSAPGLQFMMTPRAPAYPGPYINGSPAETVRQTTRQFANAVDSQLAINGAFYAAQSVNGINWANNLGIAASNGDAYSPWELPSAADFDDALNISPNNEAVIVKMPGSIPTGFETNPPVALYNTVTGSHRLVQDGINVAPISCSLCSLNPRTAVGLTADNAKLLLMTVDGRQTGYSEGVTLAELATYLLSYQAANAINLDGGGSTQMVVDYYSDALAAQLVNSPSEAERSVGTNLAVFALPNGDYNQDGVVDAADYVVWRKAIGGQYSYDAWRRSFGNSSGSAAAARTASPEPSTWVIVATSVCSFALLRTPTVTMLPAYARIRYVQASD